MSMLYRCGRSFLGALVVFAATLLVATPAWAETIVVNSLADTVTCNSICTLRGALAKAVDGDTIRFSVTGSISVGSTLQVIEDVTILGPGPSLLKLDGGGAVGIMNVPQGVTTSISGITLQNGGGPNHGNGIANAGSLSLTDVVVRDNHAPTGSNTAGGGVVSLGFDASLVILNSSIVDNSATFRGGGIYVNVGTLTIANTTVSGNSAPQGGGLYDIGAPLTVINSTFSGNSATLDTGGLYVSLTTASVTNSTFSGNSAGTIGGGIRISVSASATLTNNTLIGNTASDGAALFANSPTSLRNNLVAKNIGPTACSGNMTSQGNNLSDSPSGSTSCRAADPSRHDLVVADARVGPLALNSPGVTKTHALLPDSPAIDGVTYAATDCGTTLSADQRGISRPQVRTSARCDIGAFELEASVAPTISSVDAQTTPEDRDKVGIPFTVGDGDSPISSLVVTAASSNPSLVSDFDIAVDASGNGTIAITPAPNQNGTATITLTVSDGAHSASTSFPLTVEAMNDPLTFEVPTAAQTVRRNGTLTFSSGNGNRISVSDIDAGTDGIQVKVTATDGKVKLNGTAGLTVGPGVDGSSAFTINGAVAAVNTAFNGLRFTPTPGYAGSAALKMEAADLGHTGSGHPSIVVRTVQVTVTIPNQPPVAANDTYSVVVGQPLTVPAARGVLANDTDGDSATIQAQLVSGPTYGTLDLKTDGSFTYTPATSWTGLESFTYRASDGVLTSELATVSLNVVRSGCSPRPRIRTTTTAVHGRLQVTLAAPPLDTQTNNRLIELRFGAFDNGRVTIDNQPIGTGATYQVPVGTAPTTFMVERVTSGLPSTIRLIVRDECGDWPTFVGGGPKAF